MVAQVSSRELYRNGVRLSVFPSTWVDRVRRILLLYREHKLHHSTLGEVTVVAVALAKIRTMSTIGGFDECNVRIRHDLGPRFRHDSDERIICCVENQRGNGNPVNHIRGGGTRI